MTVTVAVGRMVRRKCVGAHPIVDEGACDSVVFVPTLSGLDLLRVGRKYVAGCGDSYETVQISSSRGDC